MASIIVKSMAGCATQPAPTFDLADEIANRLGDDYHESVVEDVVSGGGEIKLAQHAASYRSHRPLYSERSGHARARSRVRMASPVDREGS